MVNLGGRPRKYDLDEEAKSLDAWSELPDSLSLYEFTDKKEYLATDLARFSSENERFCKALRKAKERIAIRREKAVNSQKFNFGMWNRSARLYDTLLNDKEDIDADADVKRKQDIESSKQPIHINVTDYAKKPKAS